MSHVGSPFWRPKNTIVVSKHTSNRPTITSFWIKRCLMTPISSLFWKPKEPNRSINPKSLIVNNRIKAHPKSPTIVSKPGVLWCLPMSIVHPSSLLYGFHLMSLLHGLCPMMGVASWFKGSVEFIWVLPDDLRGVYQIMICRFHLMKGRLRDEDNFGDDLRGVYQIMICRFHLVKGKRGDCETMIILGLCLICEGEILS